VATAEITPATAVDPVVPLVLLVTTVAHPCPGPLYLRGSVSGSLAPTAVEAAEIAVTPRLTCVGGGCSVTGVTVPPAPGSRTVAVQEANLPAVLFLTLPVTGLYVALPAGTYELQLEVLGAHAEVSGGTVYAVDGGASTSAGRPPAP
jgi:hypothetical protein